MYIFFTCGVALWLIYGLLLSAWPIIIANSVTLLLAGTVLVMKVRNGWALSSPKFQNRLFVESFSALLPGPFS